MLRDSSTECGSSAVTCSGHSGERSHGDGVRDPLSRGSVILECKDGAYEPTSDADILAL